ncbi:PAS domain S-box protein [Haladaptatus sp. NG-WS-4]
MTSSSLTEALRETLALFEDGGDPRTTTEVADRLDLGRRSTYERLERLVDKGRLDTKKVGGNGRVWWQPSKERDRTSSNGEAAAESLIDDVPDRKREKSAHQTDRKQFKSLVDAVEEYAIFMLDPEGHVQTWNPGAGQIKGYDGDEILGTHFSTFYTDDDQAAGIPAHNLETAAREGSVEDEGWRIRADGSRFWANVTITAIRDDDGDLEGFAKVTRDMTDRKEHEQELSYERDLVKQILETVPVGIGLLSTTGDVIQANERATEILGIAEDEADGYGAGERQIYDVDDNPVPPDERPYAQVLETGEPVFNWECQVEYTDGNRRWLSGNTVPLEGSEGEIDQIIAAGTDITQFKEQTHRLERQRGNLESELEDVFERVNDGFFALDDNLRFTYVNRCASEFLDRPAAELVGEYIWDAFEPGPKAQEGFEEALDTQQPLSFEEFYEPRNTWFEYHVYPSQTGLSVYFNNITDRKEHERQLEQYETIVETMQDGVYVLDEQFQFVTVNDAYVEMTGYDREELLGEHCSIVVDDDVSAESARRVEAMLAGEAKTGVIEADIHRADGTTLRAESRFRGLAGEKQQKVGVVRDVSERVARERQLEEYRRQLETLVENYPAGAAALVDVNLRYVTFAGTVEGDADLTRADIEGRRVDEVMPPQISDVVLPRYEAALDGKHSQLEDTIDDRIYQFHFVPVRDDDGNVFAATAMSQDITERKERERHLEQQRERLAALYTITEVVRDITDAVIAQSTREEIEATVCERLAATDSYSFAWIGDVNAATKTMDVRTEAGVKGYLDDITITVDPDDERSEGPTGRAFRTGEVQTMRNLAADDRYDHWRSTAEEYGFRSSAAIPIVHEKTTYGVLNVYAERPNAFKGQERDVVVQLGEIVGHAIAAVERKRALLNDEVVELEFRIENVFESLGIDAVVNDFIQLEHTVPLDEDKYILFGRTTPSDVETMEMMVETVPFYEDVTFRDVGDETIFELRVSESPVLSVIASLGGTVPEAVIEDGDYRLTVHLSPNVDVRQVIDRINEEYPNANLMKRRQRSIRDHSQPMVPELMSDLTSRQRSALETAFHAGFFEWPRESTGEEVSALLGVSAPTFHQHLRKAEQKVFKSVLLSETSA